jgi:hypothetical protein
MSERLIYRANSSLITHNSLLITAPTHHSLLITHYSLLLLFVAQHTSIVRFCSIGEREFYQARLIRRQFFG